MMLQNIKRYIKVEQLHARGLFLKLNIIEYYFKLRPLLEQFLYTYAQGSIKNVCYMHETAKNKEGSESVESSG